MIQIDPAMTITMLRRLIRIPSVNPAVDETRDEVAVASYIADWFRKRQHFSVLEQRVDKRRFNVLAILKGKGNGRSLMLNGHMDTVGTAGMTVAPFDPIVEKGRVHGRGSCDMKGSIASMMSAMLALANSKTRLAGDVIFAAVVDEEYKSMGTAELIKRFRADAAIVGEPTKMDVAVAHKGYAWLEIETIGRPAHGSMPEKGVDAIEKMAKIISQIQLASEAYKKKGHPLVGTPRIHMSMIKGGSDWSTIPPSCTLQVERRLIPGETPKDAVNELRRIIAQCSRADRNLRARVSLVHHADSMEIDGDEEIVTALGGVLRRLGREVKIVGVPYWTDASILVNQAKIPTCLFGPGDISVAHSENEFVKIRDVLAAAQVYAEAARAYCTPM